MKEVKKEEHFYSKAAFTPGNMLPDNMLLVAGNMLPVSRQHVSLCIKQQTGNKLATILLPATSCLLQTCCRQQAVCWRQHAWCKCGLRLNIFFWLIDSFIDWLVVSAYTNDVFVVQLFMCCLSHLQSEQLLTEVSQYANLCYNNNWLTIYKAWNRAVAASLMNLSVSVLSAGVASSCSKITSSFLTELNFI